MIRLLRRVSSSRRRWSSKIWRRGTNIYVRIWRHIALVNSSLDELLGKRRRSKEKVSVLLEPLLIWTFPVFSGNSRTFRRHSRWSYIAKQRTVTGRLRWVHLPRSERSRHALHHSVWIDSGGIQHSVQPWIRCTPISIKKMPSTTRINPESQCTKILGKHIKIQYVGAIWSLLRGRDGSSIKHDLTQSLFSTLYVRYVLRK